MFLNLKNIENNFQFLQNLLKNKQVNKLFHRKKLQHYFKGITDFLEEIIIYKISWRESLFSRNT